MRRPRSPAAGAAVRAAPIARAGLAVAVALAAGCDWVDATGVQPGDGSGASVELRLDDVPLGDAAALAEGTRVRVRLAASAAVDADGTPLAFAWEPAPLAEGALEGCAALDGFDPARAPATLVDACTDPGDCGFSFVPVAADDGDGGDGDGGSDLEPGEVAFDLDVPRLRAPVGRRHALVGTAIGLADPALGGGPTAVERFRREVDFCLIAINEAPDARDDEYAIGVGETLDVGAGAGVLANDADDLDTSNAGLSVSTEPLEGPARAAFFELRADGGFTYEPVAEGSGDGFEDRFAYEVTDGVQVSRAEVRLIGIAGDRAPFADDAAAPVTVRVGEFAFVDLSGRFVDPEGAELAFSFAEPLPGDGSLALSPGGILSGVPGPGDEGEYALTLVADDGTSAVGAPLALTVEGDGRVVPLGFVPDTTFDQTLRLGRNIAPLRPRFEGGREPLTFASGGEPLPPGVVVDPDTGRVAGRPRETGRFDGLAVLARDADGAEALSDAFSIRVR